VAIAAPVAERGWVLTVYRLLRLLRYRRRDAVLSITDELLESATEVRVRLDELLAECLAIRIHENDVAGLPETYEHSPIVVPQTPREAADQSCVVADCGDWLPAN